MLTGAFAILSVAVLLGALALVPRRGVTRLPPRRQVAVVHGLIGAFGLAVFIGSLKGGVEPGSVAWAAAVLVSSGLIAGVALYVATRHRRPPPALALALHLILAGMGYLLVAGYVLD